ncbi:MAG: hypothetical protein KDC95_19220 [Planctomycetes bacterium]|nr:hypothetical protein [Planctomycetota bacterium]
MTGRKSHHLGNIPGYAKEVLEPCEERPKPPVERNRAGCGVDRGTQMGYHPVAVVS